MCRPIRCVTPGLTLLVILLMPVGCGPASERCGVDVIPRGEASADDATRLGEDMLRAFFEREFDRAREMLRAGADPNYKSDDLSLLFAATASGETADIAVSLVEHGADVNHAVDGMTAMYAAADDGSLCLVEYLLDHSAEIDAGDGSAGTALLAALNNQHDDIAEFLLERGAGINAQSSSGVTALRIAVAREDPALIKDLVRRGADPRISSAEHGIVATPAVRLKAGLRLREEAEAAPPLLLEMNPALKQALESPLSVDDFRELIDLLESTAAELDAR